MNEKRKLGICFPLAGPGDDPPDTAVVAVASCEFERAAQLKRRFGRKPQRGNRMEAGSAVEDSCNVEFNTNRYLTTKDWLSPVIGVLVAIPIIPVIGIIYLLVRLTSRGPAFYSQVRLGKHGTKFTIYKFRTMVVDAERQSGPVWARPNDPRITRIGGFLRRYHLDELPQIINVIFGNMSFVGPRPERPEIARELARSIPGYFDRLAVKPGITGMAQIHLPADTSIDSVRKKQSYDLAYVARGSFLLDCRVVVATLFKAIPFASGLPRQIGHCREFLRDATILFESSEAPIRAMAVAEK